MGDPNYKTEKDGGLGKPYNHAMKTKILRSLVLISLLIGSILNSAYAPAQPTASPADVNIGSCQLFPDNNFWNVPVDNLPVHPSSAQWINSIGADTGFHMDFGSGNWAGGPIGIPYNILSGSSVTKYNVDFYYPNESDPGPYPLPASPKIEHGGDHHILTVDTDDCTLYEIYDAWEDGGEWFGGSGAIWDLGSNALRTDTWTSADAAGLPILPGLARYNEVAAGVIEHALRFTADCTADYYIWPARHKARSGSCANPVPFGARFRLKADYDISGFPPQAQALLQAFKTYGIVLADNGSDWYVSGSPSPSWDNDELHDLDVLTGSDFEAVDTSGLKVNQNSAATTHSSTPHIYSIKRMDSNPSGAATFRFQVYFSEPVTGVDETDFDLTVTGNITGETVSSVSGSGISYVVTATVADGYGDLRLDLIDDNSILDGTSNPLGGASAGDGNYTSGEKYTRVVVVSLNALSIGTNDGWILESSETSNQGSTMNSTANLLYVGDNAQDKQYKSILSFGTAGLPDDAEIIKVQLKIKIQGFAGGNMFNTKILGNLLMDIRRPYFGSNANLVVGDFQAAAGRNSVGVLGSASGTGWRTITLNSTAYGFVNDEGTTQIRLRFTKDDNNDNGADYLKIYSGNAPEASRPQLIVEYYIP